MSSDLPFLPSDLGRPTSELEAPWWSNARERATGGQQAQRDQWLRKINLTVYGASGQDAGAGIDLSQLRITFTAKKMVTPSPNLLTARVYNLAPQTMQRVYEYKRVILAAGYQSGSYGVLFDGTVVMYVRGKENPVDSYLEIFAGDADLAINTSVINLTWPAGTTPTQKIRDALGQMQGVQVGEINVGKGEQKTLRSTSYIGPARDLIRDQTNATQSDFFVEDNTAHVVSRLGYRQGEIVTLSPRTGLIGMPRVTPAGIEATCLLNPKLRLGGLIKIDSELLSGVMFEPGTVNPGSERTPFSGPPIPQVATGPTQRFGAAGISPTGQYKILMLDHFGDTRGNPWYSEIICAGLEANGALVGWPGDALVRSVALLPGGGGLLSDTTAGGQGG